MAESSVKMASGATLPPQPRVGIPSQPLQMFNIYSQHAMPNVPGKNPFAQRSALPVVGQKRVRTEADERRAKRRKFYVDLRAVSNTIKKTNSGSQERTPFFGGQSSLRFTKIFYPQEVPAVCQRSRAPIQKTGEKRTRPKRNVSQIEISEPCQSDDFLSLFTIPSSLPAPALKKEIPIPTPTVESSSSSSSQKSPAQQYLYRFSTWENKIIWDSDSQKQRKASTPFAADETKSKTLWPMSRPTSKFGNTSRNPIDTTACPFFELSRKRRKLVKPLPKLNFPSQIASLQSRSQEPSSPDWTTEASEEIEWKRDSLDYISEKSLDLLLQPSSSSLARLPLTTTPTISKADPLSQKPILLSQIASSSPSPSPLLAPSVPPTLSIKTRPFLWRKYGIAKPNAELDDGSWADQVIWDADAPPPHSASFSALLIDLNDDAIGYTWKTVRPMLTQARVYPQVTPGTPVGIHRPALPPPSLLPATFASASNVSQQNVPKPAGMSPGLVPPSFVRQMPVTLPTSLPSPSIVPPPLMRSGFPGVTLQTLAGFSSSISNLYAASPNFPRPIPYPMTVEDDTPRASPIPTVNMIYFFPSVDPILVHSKRSSRNPFFLSYDDVYARTQKERFVKKRKNALHCRVTHTLPARTLATFSTSLPTDDLRMFRRPKIVLTARFPYRVAPRRAEDIGPIKVDLETWGKKKDDFSACRGDIVMLEHVLEEAPHLITAPGMVSQIWNYYRKESRNDESGPSKIRSYRHGGTRILEDDEEIPFLGAVNRGRVLRMFQNTLYSLPLAQHATSSNLFLLVRNRKKPSHFTIRECPHLFACGQEQPLREIYTPNARTTTNIVKTRLQAYIYRLFSRKKGGGVVKHSEVYGSFPGHSDSSIRKCLKDCGSFRRQKDGVYWTVKERVAMPTEEELQAMITPEEVCIVEGIMAGLQRLQDDGVHRFKLVEDFQHVLSGLDGEIREEAKMVEDLLHTTPWHLSANFVHSVIEKASFRLAISRSHAAAGERYCDPLLLSFVRRKEQKIPKVRDPIASTNADLRKLGTADAKLYLLKFGYTERDFLSLSRWDLIQIVRQCSSQAAAKGAKGNVAMFARGPRYFSEDNTKKYRLEIKETFERQLKHIAETEVSSSDESDADESHLNEEAENLESFVSKQDDAHPSGMVIDHDIGCNFAEMVEAHRREEEEKERLREREKRIHENPKAVVSQRLNARPGRRKILKRTRTVKDADGGESIFVDYIRDPKQILFYLDEQILPPPPVTPLGSIGFGGQRRKILRKPAPMKKKPEGKEKEGEGEGEAMADGEGVEGSDADVSMGEEGDRPIALFEKREREEGTVLVIRKKDDASASSGSASTAPIKVRLTLSRGLTSPAVAPISLSPSPSLSPFAGPLSANANANANSVSAPKTEKKKKKKKKAKVKERVPTPKEDVPLSPPTPPLPPSSPAAEVIVPKIKFKFSQSLVNEREERREAGEWEKGRKEEVKKKENSAKKRKRKDEETPPKAVTKKPKMEISPASSSQPLPSPLPSTTHSSPLSSLAPPPSLSLPKVVVDNKEWARLREERRQKFMAIVQSLYSLDQFVAFKEPVSELEAPGYFSVISTPLCLQDMWIKAQRSQYANRVTFLSDIQLIVRNCKEYCTTRYPVLLPAAAELLRMSVEMIHATNEEWWREREEFGVIEGGRGGGGGRKRGKGGRKGGGKGGGRGGIVPLSSALPSPSLPPPIIIPSTSDSSLSVPQTMTNPGDVVVSNDQVSQSPSTPVFLDESVEGDVTTPNRVLSDSDSEATPLFPEDYSDVVQSSSSKPPSPSPSPSPSPPLLPSSSLSSSSSSSSSSTSALSSVSVSAAKPSLLKIRFTTKKNIVENN